MKINFKNSIAYRVFTLATKIEKFAADAKKINEIEKLQIVAELQSFLEQEIDKLHNNVQNTTLKLKEGNINEQQ